MPPSARTVTRGRLYPTRRHEYTRRAQSPGAIPMGKRLVVASSTEVALTKTVQCPKLTAMRLNSKSLCAFPKGMMRKRATISSGLFFATLVLCATVFTQSASAQIAKVFDDTGRQLFINSEPPKTAKLFAAKPRATIYLPAESSLTGRGRPGMNVDRDGVEKLVREAADRHRVDPALVRAVIETESNWNPKAYSHKGAGGLMQLIPTTAQRYGAYDVFNPQQNVDAGVKYLKTLLERYDGNLDLALAAYNAGEGAVDRAHGIPAFRETRNYVQRVQEAYFRPGSGRLADAFINTRAIHKDVTPEGRIVFTND
jgi:transglycosylase-like protein with SLT domain